MRSNRIDAIGVSGPLTCERGIGAPEITICDAGSMSNPTFEPSLQTVTGRVADNVHRLEARYPSGPPIQATVENGWFLFTDTSRHDAPDAFVALDEGGNEVGRLGRPSEPPVFSSRTFVPGG